MQQLKEEEQKQIIGGAISAAMINNFIKGATFLLELGRSLGSAIRRGRSKNFC